MSDLNAKTPLNYSGWPCEENVTPSDTVSFAPSWLEIMVAGTIKYKNAGSGQDVIKVVTEAMCPYYPRSPVTMVYNTGTDVAFDTAGTLSRTYNPR